MFFINIRYRMKPSTHFIIQISFLVCILIFLYLYFDCNDTLIMSNTNNPEIDKRPIWICPREKKISRLTHIYNHKRSHQNMGIFDKFSVTHITHGLILFWLLYKFNNNKRTISIIYASILLEILWEIFENSPYIIFKYRQGGVSSYRNYRGNSIANTVSDVLFTVLGLLIAWYLPSHSLIPVIIFTEIFTYLIVGDNLIKNIYNLFIRAGGV